MPVKIIATSDVCLEYKFKHMTTKVHQLFEEHLLSYWDAFVVKVIEQKPDCLVIVGNLFFTPRPRNKTLQVVIASMQKLTGAGIEVFIYPGPRDTPLFHAHDAFPHLVLESVKGVHVLAKDTSDITKQILKPVFSGTVGDTPLEIYAPPNPLFQLSEMDLAFKADKNCISLFLLNGRFVTDDGDEKNSYKAIKLENTRISTLAKAGVNCIFLGGYNDKIPAQKGAPRILICPPLFPVDFSREETLTGMSIFDLDKKAGIKEKQVPLSYYTIKQVSFNVTHEQASDINDTVKDLVRKDSDRNSMFQIRLAGNLPRNDYHAVKFYEIAESGSRRNFYFELVDEIAFEEKSMDVSGLHPVLETEKLVQALVIENPKERQVLEKSLAMIKADWEDLE